MSTTYAIDVASHPQAAVVQWRPRYKTQDQRELELRLAFTLGAATLGAIALGAVTMGVLAIRRANAGGGRWRRLDLDDLGVGRIRHRPRRHF